MLGSTQRLAGALQGLLAAGALIAAGASVARAQELCVTCEEPFALYRCAFDDHSPIRVTAPGAPLVCAKQLAHRGNHARCSIRRNSSGLCEGELVIVTPPADMPLAVPPGFAAGNDTGAPNGTALTDPAAAPGIDGPAASAAPSGDPSAPVAASEDTAQGEPSEAEEHAGPPKTVEELAKRTAKSSKEGLEDAGEAVVGAAKKTGEAIGDAGSAVGDAAKSTWRCLSTLFSDC